MRRFFLVCVLTSAMAAPAAAGGASSGDLEALMQAIAVSGREEAAAQVVIAHLPEGLAERDRLGNVVVTLGEGEPRRLVACGLDEPGFVVSEIRDDGYLRLRPAGRGGRGALWAQGFEGQKVWISTAAGLVAGGLAVPSTHLYQDGRPEKEPLFSAARGFVDVGADTAEQVRAQGIEMLDPVGRHHRLTAYGDGLIAGPAAQSKGTCAALLSVARRLAAEPPAGTLVLAWTRLDLWNRKGIEHLVIERGPFSEAQLASRGFGWVRGEEGLEVADLPDIGSGVLAAGAATLPGGRTDVAHLAPRGGAYTGGPDWADTVLGFFAVSARYRETQVETVALSDVETLAQAIVDWAGGGGADASRTAEPIDWRKPVDDRPHADAATVLADLIGVYGVSGHEGPVREAIIARLPDWAEPRVDDRGNLLLEIGEGEEHVAFVAHLDEVGFEVETILDDGRLELSRRGGLAPSLWEAQGALVHTARGEVSGIFEPRAGWLEAEARRPTDALTAYLGTTSRQETLGLGVAVGDSVTMPKEMLRLGEHRAVARAFDDRVGSTAQLLALARIDPETVDRRVTFAWVVEEEVGLFGSVAMGSDMPDIDRVHAVDTFVSSDDPYPDKGFALTPLGEGLVLRAMDNSYLADRATIDYVRDLAASHNIPTQIGFTGGGNDGTAYIANGATNLPLSWPGRSSHSPAEIMDLRDLDALVDLIVALVED